MYMKRCGQNKMWGLLAGDLWPGDEGRTTHTTHAEWSPT